MRILRLLILLFSVNLFGASYFVDFTGADTNNGTAKGTPFKHSPGMTGCTNTCASTTLAAGDTVTFKGGVTWTSSYPWTLSSGSGGGGNVSYTTDHTWFTGGGYTQPIFDDGHAAPGATGMANSTGGSYITLNDLKFVNCGTAQTTNTDKCLVWSHVHDITITNSTFACECWITNYFTFDSAGSYSNFTITGNDFSHTSGAVWFGTAQASTTAHTVTYTGNTFHDFASQIGGGVHGDGAWHSFGVPSSDATQYVDAVTFCNNRFYGDFQVSFAGGGGMTAMFFFEGSFSGTICNNDMSYTPAAGAGEFQALIYGSGYSNSHASTVGIYNNSLALIGTNSVSAAVDFANIGSGSAITYKNNIVYNPQYFVFIEDPGSAAAFTSDYNIWTSTSGTGDYQGSFKSYAQWQGLGYDAHGLMGSDPSWVSAPGNENLTSGSPARSAGINLTSLSITILDSDYNSVARPGGATAWDIGAYQYAAGSATLTVAVSSATIWQGASSFTSTATVTNNGGGSTDGTTVTVVVTLPSGFTATAISGTGWAGAGCNTTSLTCTRTDVLAAAGSYPVISVTSSVSRTATIGTVSLTAQVSGGGSAGTNLGSGTETIVSFKGFR